MKTPTFLDNPAIRKQLIDGELYYSVIDAIKVILDTDFKSAQNYYHVLKNRFTKNGDPFLPNAVQRKEVCNDQKMRLTTFINLKEVYLLQEYLKTGKRKIKPSFAKQDEILKLHPLVIAIYRFRGWEVKHHVRLRSNSVVDIIISKGDKEFVIECKPRLNKSSVYQAIGQVLCYCNEYNYSAYPMIVCKSADEYSKTYCHRLGIEINIIDNPSFDIDWDRLQQALEAAVSLTLQQQTQSTTNLETYFKLWNNFINIYIDAENVEIEFQHPLSNVIKELITSRIHYTEIVTVEMAMEIVWEIAKAINKQAKSTSELLGIDLVTEKPLLRKGSKRK
jgi:predicted RecB family endonuclease